MTINKQFFNIIQKLELQNERFILTVSGGPDSICLLKLFTEYFDPQKIIVVTINHKLRSEADQECLYVRDLCLELKVTCHVVERNIEQVKLNNQQDARDFRYQQFKQIAQKYNINNIVTAHHYDDMIENFMIRLSRGSGIDGLAVADIISENQDLYFIKPLLGFRKKQLLDYLDKLNIQYFIDNSNYSDKYLRNRIRKQLLDYSELELSRIALAAINLTRANYAKIEFLNLILRSYLIKYSLGCIRIDLEDYLLQPYEIRLALLSRIISYLGKKESPCGLNQLINLDDQISEQKKFKKTLNGLGIELDMENNMFIFYQMEKIDFQSIFPKQKLSIGDYLIINNSDSVIELSNLNQKEFDKLALDKTTPYYFILKKIRKYIPCLIIQGLKKQFIIPTLTIDNIEILWQPKRKLEKYCGSEQSIKLLEQLVVVK